MKQPELLITEDEVHNPPIPSNGKLATIPTEPLHLIEMALSKGADPATLEKLMALAERWQANMARNAFNEAMAAFKREPLKIEKNKHVKFNSKSGGVIDYWHATLDNVAAVIGEAMNKHGLHFTWRVEQGGPRIKVTCIVKHELGHSEEVWMDGPPDESGLKNPLQQVGSTVSYLERYTLLAAAGMATEEQDNDGRGGNGNGDGGTLEDLRERLEFIENCRNRDELARVYHAAVKMAEKVNDREAIRKLEEAKAKKLRELV